MGLRRMGCEEVGKNKNREEGERSGMKTIGRIGHSCEVFGEYEHSMVHQEAYISSIAD